MPNCESCGQPFSTTETMRKKSNGTWETIVILNEPTVVKSDGKRVHPDCQGE